MTVQHHPEAARMFRGGESSRIFGFAHAIALVALLGGFLVGGTQGLVVVALLGVLEIAVSFDNAIVNATVLARMNRYWQRMFMTVGVLIAAIGMRLLLPLIIVAIGAHLSPWRAVDLAYADPNRYHALLLTAQPGIAAFGGIFLLMIAIGFFREERDVHWCPAVERHLPVVLGRRGVPVLIALLFTAVARFTVPAEDHTRVLVGCLVGLVCYLGINLLSTRVADRADADGSSRPRATVQGRGAFLLFVYLELLDATFSMDSVMGAFSVTVDIALITLGLAIGAAYIRSLTVYVVRKGTLDEYRYLEHGAYYSIALLAILLLWEVWRDVPDWITACTGAIVITAAWLTSIWAGKRQQREDAVREASADREPATIQAFTGGQPVQIELIADHSETGYSDTPPVAS
ncbi:DUF475 domain-containing protein [Actinospica sp. MGRD01-02]|uniref:DUF475 domain-containing protein n=1 Tax=Actinospica acidithermotolerans TaxID=2828514 RepID=A0A941EC94_9ACTN|nr:DUF475 domain-containing protein [Actinospica acidithermotolerans]MBR7830105.1 DUF475 domain-containing protein [Actinospica acidithermotolerans]